MAGSSLAGGARPQALILSPWSEGVSVDLHPSASKPPPAHLPDASLREGEASTWNWPWQKESKRGGAGTGRADEDEDDGDRRDRGGSVLSWQEASM